MMPISVDWHEIEPTIRHWRFVGLWSWVELKEQLAQSVPAVEALPGRTDAIMDFTQAGMIVPGWLVGLRGVAPRAARNLRMVVVVTANPVILTALRMFRTVNPRPQLRLASAPSVEEAISAIRADRLKDTGSAAGV
jgi:hypothetical protein